MNKDNKTTLSLQMRFGHMKGGYGQALEVKLKFLQLGVEIVGNHTSPNSVIQRLIQRKTALN